MREAQWALRAGTEAEIAEERRRDRGRRWMGWAFTVGLGGLLPASCGGFLSHLFDATPIAWAFWPLLATVGLGLEYGRRCQRSQAFSTARMAALREEYDDVPGWLAEVCVLQGAAPTGYDRGILWFEDDRLVFVGERTSFALATSTVFGSARDHSEVRGLLSAVTIPLDAHSPAGPVALGIDVFADYAPGRAFRGPEGFRRTLGGWLAGGFEGEGQLPPLTLGPEAPKVATLLGNALAVSAAWAALAAILTFSLVTVGAGSLIVAIFVGAGLLACRELWTLRLRWQAYLDRLRLERGR